MLGGNHPFGKFIAIYSLHKVCSAFRILQALTASTFLLIGYWLKKADAFYSLQKRVPDYAVIAFTLVTLLMMHKCSVAMRVNAMPWNLLSFALSTWISVLVVYWCSKLENCKSYIFSRLCNFLKFCGTFSLIFLCVHDIETSYGWSTYFKSCWIWEFIVRIVYILLITYILTKTKLSKKIFNVA